MAVCPFAAMNPINGYPGLTYDPAYALKGVLHSTEVAGIYTPRADGSYFGGASPPHFTIDEAKVWQHIDTRKASYALVNEAGGAETNRGGAIQVEIMWRAGWGADWPPALAANVARWMRWVEQTHGVRSEPIDGFHAYPPEGGWRLGREPWRLTQAMWVTWDGWVGHQHAPENSHGDPGLIPLAVLFPKVRPAELEEDDMAITFIVGPVNQSGPRAGRYPKVIPELGDRRLKAVEGATFTGPGVTNVFGVSILEIDVALPGLVVWPCRVALGETVGGEPAMVVTDSSLADFAFPVRVST